jgi:outer membrane receptor for ferrienterochelin and colicins
VGQVKFVTQQYSIMGVKSSSYQESNDITFTIPSLFVQDEVSPAEWLTIATSLRWDLHSEYGGFLNPRASVLFRPGAEWNLRLSAGTGYFAPTPFTEETEAIGLSRLEPLRDLKAERARSASLDVGRSLGPLELNATLFGSEIRDALLLRSTGSDRVELFNASRPTRTYGTDLLARYHADPLHLTATYTYTRSSEEDPDGGARREVPLTPRHAAGMVGIAELGDGRLGLELYYTGRQTLDEDPFRSVSRPYFVVGLLGERRVGRMRVFLNAENLLDARQSRFDPLLRPTRSRIGRWTTDAWAPLEGRSFNAGVRWEF